MATSNETSQNNRDQLTVTEQIKLFLVTKAMLRQTTCYEEVAQHVGLPDTGNQLGAALSEHLGNIYRWYEVRHLPKLTSIVVRKSGADEGIPGRGFWELLGMPGILIHGSREVRRLIVTRLQREVFDYYGGSNTEGGNRPPSISKLPEVVTVRKQLDYSGSAADALKVCFTCPERMVRFMVAINALRRKS